MLDSLSGGSSDGSGGGSHFEWLGEGAHTAGVLSTDSEVVLLVGVEVLNFE